MEKKEIRSLYCKQLRKILIGPYGGSEEELKSYKEHGEGQSSRFIKPRDQYLSGWLVPFWLAAMFFTAGPIVVYLFDIAQFRGGV